ncbi:Arginase/deacetylase, partial [Violaceomyces palustris]
MSQTLPDQPSLAEEQRSQPLLESTSEEIGSGMWRGRTEGRRRKVSYILSPSLMKTSDKLPSNRGRSTLVHSLTFHLDLLDLETLQEAISEDEQGFSDDGYGEGDPDEDRDRDRRSEKFAEFLKSLGFDEEGGHPLGRIASRGESNGGASLEFPRGAEDPAELGPRSNLNRAKVVRPERASKERLESYHTRRFVEKLLSGKVIQTNDADPSRRKRSRVDPNGSNVSKGFDGSASRGRGFRGGREYEGFGGEDSDSTLTEQDDSEDEDESLEMKQDDMIRLRSSSIVGGRKRMRGYKKRKVTNQFGLQDDCPPFKGLDEHVKLIAGASITAAEEIASGRADVAIAWDGGRHHAKKDAASGFCYINDIVLAILALRKPRKVKVEVEDIEEDHGGTRMDDAKVKEEGRVTDGSSAKGDGFHPDKKSKEEGLTGVEDAKTVPTADQTPTVENGKTPKVPSRPTTVVKRIERVLYIDIDLHWGDGVEEAFYNSPNVLTLSLHHYSKGFFPCYSDSRDPEDPTVGPPGSRDSSGGPKNDPKAASKALSLPLLAGLSGENLERVIKTCVEPVFKAYD